MNVKTDTPPTSDAMAQAYQEAVDGKIVHTNMVGLFRLIDLRAREIAAQPGEGVFSSVHETDGQAVIRWVAQGQIFGPPTADDARRYIAELEPSPPHVADALDGERFVHDVHCAQFNRPCSCKRHAIAARAEAGDK